MKKLKKVISLIIVIVMVLSMANVAFASTTGGITKYPSLNEIIKAFNPSDKTYLDIYLSYADTEKLIDKLDTLKNPTFKDFYDITKDMVKGGTSWFTSFLWAFTGRIHSDTVSEIKSLNRKGQGVIISFPTDWTPGLPIVRSQSGPDAPAAERVQITVTASPSEGGKTAGGGSILKYVATANNRLTRIQLNAYPNSGWQFDGWYEGGTLVSSNAVYSFDAERNRTLEARFNKGQSTSTPSTQPQLTVASTVEGSFTVTVPANYTLDCFRTPTATTRYTHVTARSSSYQIHCTKQLNMSDGSIRYFFISGNNNECYFAFTSSMNVNQNTSSIPETSFSNQIEWDKSSVIAITTLKAGKTYEISNPTSDLTEYINNNYVIYDLVCKDLSGKVISFEKNRGEGYWGVHISEIYIPVKLNTVTEITLKDKDMILTIPTEWCDKNIVIKEIK